MKIAYKRVGNASWRAVEFPDDYYTSYGQIVPATRTERRGIAMAHNGYALRIYKDAARKRCVFIDVVEPHWYVIDDNIRMFEQVTRVAEDGNVWTGEGVERREEQAEEIEFVPVNEFINEAAERLERELF